MRNAFKTHEARRKSHGHARRRSIVEAVNQGWEIREQLSSWHFDGHLRPRLRISTGAMQTARDGFFRLKKPRSRETLMIPFRALYDLGKPYFFGGKRP